MTCAPVGNFALHLDIASEMKRPAKPTMAANTKSALRSKPALLVGMVSMPSGRIEMLSAMSAAKLVTRNRATRLNITALRAPSVRLQS